MIKKYVISLHDSSRRKDFFSQDYAKDFEIFNAFDGRNGEGKEYFDLNKFISSHDGRSPRNSEMGCVISHLKAMEAFLEEPSEYEYLLVAEDDVYFVDDFEKIFCKILKKMGDVDYVILGDAMGREAYTGILNFPSYSSHMSFLNKKIFVRKTLHSMGRFTGNPWGTGLYLVSRKGARKYVNFWKAQKNGIWWLADDYEKVFHLAAIDLYHVRPALARFDMFSDSSEAVNGDFYQDNLRDNGHLLEKSFKNYLKFFKLKTIMRAKSTIADIRYRK